MSRPDLTIVVKPPKSKVDWDVVDGFEESRDPDGGAVEPLVAVNEYVAPPKEAQSNHVRDVGEGLVAGGSVVDREVADKRTRRVRKFPGGDPRAVDYEGYGVCYVELPALGLDSVCKNDPAAHAVRAADLLYLHVGRLLP